MEIPAYFEDARKCLIKQVYSSYVDIYPNSKFQSPIFQSQSGQFSTNTLHNFQGQQNIPISVNSSIFTTFQYNQSSCINSALPSQNCQIQANPDINFPYQNAQDLETRVIQGSSNIDTNNTNFQLSVNTSTNFSSSFQSITRQPGAFSFSSKIRANAASLLPLDIMLDKSKEERCMPLSSGRPNYKKGFETARLKEVPGYDYNFEEDSFYQLTGKKKLEYYIGIGKKYNIDFYKRIHSKENPLPKFGRNQKRNKSICIHFLHGLYDIFPEWFQKNL